MSNSGVCVLINEDAKNEQQVAVFCINESDLYAVGNWDPIGNANVIYRGIIGSLEGDLVVASPLYKQHFSLESGVCKEDPNVAIPAFEVRVANDNVEIFC